MELDQVVYEYGKLQLNFVACQRQATLMATQLAQANKQIAALTKDKGKAEKRVTQLESEISLHGLTLPEPIQDPEPAKGDATKAAVDAADSSGSTDLGRGVMAQSAQGNIRTVPRPIPVDPEAAIPQRDPDAKPSTEN